MALNLPLIQMALTTLLALPGAGRPVGKSLKKLLIAVLGMVVAAVLGAVAVVTAVFATVLWLMPPATSLVEVCFLSAAVLGLMAVVMGLAASKGQSPQTFVEEAVDEAFPTMRSPVEGITGAFRGLLDAFDRGWNAKPTRY